MSHTQTPGPARQEAVNELIDRFHMKNFSFKGSINDFQSVAIHFVPKNEIFRINEDKFIHSFVSAG
jgi:hypothetical protein